MWESPYESVRGSGGGSAATRVGRTRWGIIRLRGLCDVGIYSRIMVGVTWARVGKFIYSLIIVYVGFVT